MMLTWVFVERVETQLLVITLSLTNVCMYVLCVRVCEREREREEGGREGGRERERGGEGGD